MNNSDLQKILVHSITFEGSGKGKVFKLQVENPQYCKVGIELSPPYIASEHNYYFLITNIDGDIITASSETLTEFEEMLNLTVLTKEEFNRDIQLKKDYYKNLTYPLEFYIKKKNETSENQLSEKEISDLLTEVKK